MPRRLHNWRTHPADLHPGRTQDNLRAQQRLMVQGRLGGWLLRAQVRSLRTAPLAHSSGSSPWIDFGGSGVRYHVGPSPGALHAKEARCLSITTITTSTTKAQSIITATTTGMDIPTVWSTRRSPRPPVGFGR